MAVSRSILMRAVVTAQHAYLGHLYISGGEVKSKSLTLSHFTLILIKPANITGSSTFRFSVQHSGLCSLRPNIQVYNGCSFAQRRCECVHWCLQSILFIFCVWIRNCHTLVSVLCYGVGQKSVWAEYYHRHSESES